ncbi:alanine-phosphoribitol ligase [Actinoplanes sp. OR16]|uniref:styrene monooxygenase/indole monooxygenase family protein n=1 Tax=Actinoplanes sp. OR16 TaxID=946334 RepID=UPI000F6B4F4A|nr:styrene monooxygenase/indole monooxygenase family protein [Actinoplanes sp. OR16]BBH70496.1 alanine-phosphoribitol ligase [Actinoplanes sp. OR16]
MRDILIVGAGQAGLQLSLSLKAAGYRVTLMAAKTPGEIRDGWPTSTQAMFDPALETERAYGLNHYDLVAPPIRGLHVMLAAPPGNLALQFTAPLGKPAFSTDQRIKFSRWLTDAEQAGVEVIYQPVSPAYLEALTKQYDLTVVAAGRGDLVELFERDPERSPYEQPQRGLAVAYVHGLAPDPSWPEPHVEFHAIPGLGELFVIPTLTRTGPADILFWEVLPGGPLDVFGEDEDHLQTSLNLIKENLPWFHERCADVRLADDKATLQGRFTPTVRKPIAHLTGGGKALGIGDIVIANDPITGQGANTAAKAAHHYLRAIVEHGDKPFDEEWMTATFESFWQAHGRAVTLWTNGMLQPLPPHAQQILGAASANPAVAARFAHGFEDPNDLLSWFADPAAADAYLRSL